MCPVSSEWWVLHHSVSEQKLAAFMTIYLDESATETGGRKPSPVAVVGGILLDYPNYSELKESWIGMLDEFPELKPGLHMKDFGSHGRLSSVDSHRRRAIFSRASSIVGRNRTYTFSAILRHEDYVSALSENTRSTHSQYELLFIQVAMAICGAANLNEYDGPIAFVMDEGNPHAEHVRLAHKEMRVLQSRDDARDLHMNLGGLTFENDEVIMPLQAADMISWGERRKSALVDFLEGTEPILDLLTNARHHLPAPIDLATMRSLERIWALNP